MTHNLVTFTAEQDEAHRIERLTEAAAEREYSEDELKERFAPGTRGCHEALHVASMLCDSVDRYLCEHPAALAYPVGVRSAWRAVNLYLAIGTEHLGVDNE